jgi:hypothetical protein
MTERIISRVIWASLLGAVAAFSADVTGLRHQSEIKITAQLVGAPFEGAVPPAIWAMSFSPDKKYLALGVQFIGADFAKDFTSYLLVVSPDHPDVVLKRFEMSLVPAVQRFSRLTWSPDGRFVGVTPYGKDWTQVAAVDLNSNQVHIVTNRNGSGWCGGIASILPGPQVMEVCSDTSGNALRFLRVDGAAAQEGWTFPGGIGLLDVSPDRRLVALDFPGPRGNSPIRQLYEIVILNLGDRTEVRRWSLPEATRYRGTFADSGRTFCTERFLLSESYVFQSARNKDELVCRDIATGEEKLRRDLPLGAGDVHVVGSRLYLLHNNILPLPFYLFGASEITMEVANEIWDLQTGQRLARWKVKLQKVTPKATAGFQSAVSSNGDKVAIGGSGAFTVYRVSP